MKKLLIICLVAALLVGAVYLLNYKPKTLVNATYVTQTANQPLNADEIFTLVNNERTRAGVKPLVRDARLDASAQLKVDDMTLNNYFAHENPTTGISGYTLIPNGVCVYKTENISQGAIEDMLVVNGWVNSRPHHDAMLDEQFDITGVAVNGNKVVQHFCNLK